MTSIPSENDWRSEPWDLDIPYAYEHFAGKSNDDATELFVDNAIYYQEDLTFMPIRCLRYYIHSYMAYLLSDASEEDPDGASCFYGLVEVRHEDIRTFDDATRSRVVAVLHRLAMSQDWYGADGDIYGDFKTQSERCVELLQ
jgi:hypothetical protein